MVNNKYEHLSNITRLQLDNFLVTGSFRIQQGIITTDVIPHDDMLGWKQVFWLRYDLKKNNTKNNQGKSRLKKAGFEIRFLPFAINIEVEALFAKYITGIDFPMSESARKYLLGESEVNIFDSRMVEVRDNGKLIAVGFYDVGLNACAGILNIYHPDYKKYSPGKQLIYEIMEQSRLEGFHYFYPGYCSAEVDKFSYKLGIGKSITQVYDREGDKWQDLLR